MLNYHKTYRESLEKSKKRPTPKKQPTINRSHTSSINLKLSADLDQMKASIKNFKQNNDPLRKESLVSHSKSKSNIKNDHATSTSQFKYSFKIKQDGDAYDGSRVRMKTNYEQSSCLKPFRESNRCLITDRNEKPQNYTPGQKSQSKKNEYLRTQYKQNSENQYYLNNEIVLNHDLLKLNDIQNKCRKQTSTKHNSQSLNAGSNPGVQMVKIPLSQLKKMYEQNKNFENQIALLQKEVNFYRKAAGKTSKNSVILALAE